jgi:hypothetical protein
MVRILGASFSGLLPACLAATDNVRSPMRRPPANRLSLIPNSRVGRHAPWRICPRRKDAVENGERARPGRCRRRPRRRFWHWDQGLGGSLLPRTVRREGAPNYSRGGCAPYKISEFGFNSTPAHRSARERPGADPFGVPGLRGNCGDGPTPPEGGTPNKDSVKRHP